MNNKNDKDTANDRLKTLSNQHDSIYSSNH